VARRDQRARALTSALLALVLSGCSGTAGGGSPHLAEVDSAAPARAEVHSYVALGDSFTAAPLVPTTDVADGCFRSGSNYPALLAARLQARLTDVSCSAADTGDVTGPQTITFGAEPSKVPPQIRAVRPGTDLVTIGIGGNDESLFSTLVKGCTSVADQPGAPCAALLRSSYGDPATVLHEVGARVARVLRAIHQAAPDAEVVLVGYPRLVDPDHPCSAMPIADGDLPVVARLESRLNQTLARAAVVGHADYVDMHALSEGHEICSDEPWVNGKTTDDTRALAFHPFIEEQRAVTEAILELL
jgi:lysophospholipase L1-like esterase